MNIIEYLEEEYKECCERKSKARKHYIDELKCCLETESTLNKIDYGSFYKK